MGLALFLAATIVRGTAFPATKVEATALVPPTMWSVSIDNPPCQLQVYIGRLNTTREAASCKSLCVDAPVNGGQPIRLRMLSREEGGTWQEGAVPWAAWEADPKRSECATFKNWSNNRFREARIVAVGGR